MDQPCFVEALKSRSLRAVRKVPKSDLHNHCLLGARRSVIEKAYGKKMPPFREGALGIAGLNQWIIDHYRPFFELPGSFETAVGAAFIQARVDGVTVLEMSVDINMGSIFNIPVSRVIDVLREAHRSNAPLIDFRPEIGISRRLAMRQVLILTGPWLDSGFFRSIDLYDDEFAQPVKNYRELYRYARSLGMKCKAHAGEFGDAESVREAVETLELEAVQHGIGAAGSAEVMRWLADRGTVLNVCPTSNLKLKRVRSYQHHPVKILFDNGVKVTINTDDALIFGDGVSEQFLKLHRAGLFSASELDLIRKNGLTDH